MWAVSRDNDSGSLRHHGQPLPPGVQLGTCQAVENILPSLLFLLGNPQATIILGGAKSSKWALWSPRTSTHLCLSANKLLMHPPNLKCQ